MTQTEKALEKANKQEVKSIRDWIADPQMQRQFKMALPKFFTPERFVRIALTQLTKNPRLAECTQPSVMACLLSCAELGIEPDGRKAHLIPYRNKATGTTICTLIVDYKGLVDLARRSGEISDIHADVICSNDIFEHSFGTNGTLVHKPNLDDRGVVRGAYSFAKLKDGSCSYEVMGLKEIEAIRTRSKAKDSGPWITDWNEMAKKTVFRRHSKWLPVSSEFQEAIDKDFDVPIDITPPKQPQITKEGSDSALLEIEAETVSESPKTAIPEGPGGLSEEEKAEIVRKEAEEAQKQLTERKKRSKSE